MFFQNHPIPDFIEGYIIFLFEWWHLIRLRSTNDKTGFFFVGRGFCKRLSGTPGQIEGGSPGISFHLLLYGDVYGTAGQCLLHNTASLDEILNEIAFLNNANWSACLGSLKTGIFFRSSRGISLLKWFWLHPGTRHFFPWSNIVFNKISNFRLLFFYFLQAQLKK